MENRNSRSEAELITAICGKLPLKDLMPPDKVRTAFKAGHLVLIPSEVEHKLLNDEDTLDKLIAWHNKSKSRNWKKFRRMLDQLPSRSRINLTPKLKETYKRLKPWQTIAYKRRQYRLQSANAYMEKESKSSFEQSLDHYKHEVIESLLSGSLFTAKWDTLFPLDARQRHAYVLGASGSGKTEFIKLFVWSDLQQKVASFVLDPHGDLVNECNQLITKKEIIYLSVEFGKDDLYWRYNPLHHDFHNQPPSIKQPFISLRAAELMNAFEKIMGSEFSANMQRLIYNSLLLLLNKPGMRFNDFLNLLRPSQCEKYVKMAENHYNQNVQLYFTHDFHQKTLNITKQSVLTRFENALSNYHVNNIFDCKKSSFDLKGLLDKGKCILVNLSQGVLGEMGTRILGAFLVSEITTHALARANVAASSRTPIFCYIDECQNFLSERIDKILAEGRKYGIHLIMANQFLDQFGENRRLRESVLANTNIKCFGATSSKDYIRMAKETGYESKSVPVLRYGKFIAKVGDFTPFVFQGGKFLLPGDNGIKNPKYYLNERQHQARLEQQKSKYYVKNAAGGKQVNADSAYDNFEIKTDLL